jgi:N-acetylglucosaminyldiphosphoundecaprenol N-acetyl-beta-D-mannosaminyltransferase
MESLTLFHSYINIRTVEDYFEHLTKSFNGHSPSTFFYLNTFSSYLCGTDARFRIAFNSSDYILPDGSSIVLAVRLLYGISIEKVTINHTFVELIGDYFNKNRTRLFLFGSTEENLRGASARLRVQYPGIVLAGSHHGYVRTEAETDAVVAMINAAEPTVLFVGMGMPLSELWIAENKHRLTVPCIVTVGNLFDIIAGAQHIAPRWIVNSGFEWMYRMFQEPLRLAPRYLKANSRYLVDLLHALGSRRRQ